MPCSLKFLPSALPEHISPVGAFQTVICQVTSMRCMLGQNLQNWCSTGNEQLLVIGHACTKLEVWLSHTMAFPSYHSRQKDESGARYHGICTLEILHACLELVVLHATLKPWCSHTFSDADVDDRALEDIRAAQLCMPQDAL